MFKRQSRVARLMAGLKAQKPVEVPYTGPRYTTHGREIVRNVPAVRPCL